MISPKDSYNVTKQIDGIESIAFSTLFENYLKNDLEGSKKLIEIDSTDQESVLNKLAKGRPFEGMIYTFIHTNNKNLVELENYKTGKTVEFHDFTPILFCTSFNPEKALVKGLNLNMLPKLERMKFLQAFYEVYKDFFDRVEEQTEYDKLAVNKEYRVSALSGKNPKLFEFFNRSQNALFNFAYRSYDLRNIRKLRMIEYAEWKYVPFFDARISFRKANLELIYQAYRDNKNKAK